MKVEVHALNQRDSGPGGNSWHDEVILTSRVVFCLCPPVYLCFGELNSPWGTVRPE